MTSSIYDRLRRLIEWTAPPESLALSLYLDVSPGQQEQAVEYAQSTIEELLETHEESPDAERFSKLVETWLDRLPNIVTKARAKDYDGLALFLCAQPFIEESLSLRFALENNAVIGNHLSLASLLTVAEEYEKSICLLIESGRVRLCEVHIGDIVRITEIKPTTHRDLLSELDRTLRRLVDDDPALHLIVFVAPDMNSSVEGALSDDVKIRVIEKHQRLYDPEDPKFLAMVHRCLQRYERRAEAQGVKRLLALKSEGARAAVGLQETLDIVNKGCVEVLYMLQSFEAPGWICDVCDHIGALPQPPACLACGATVSDIDLEDILIAKAASCGAEIETVYENDDLFEVGGVGAMPTSKIT